jgi:hypothetical protein
VYVFCGGDGHPREGASRGPLSFHLRDMFIENLSQLRGEEHPRSGAEAGTLSTWGETWPVLGGAEGGADGDSPMGGRVLTRTAPDRAEAASLLTEHLRQSRFSRETKPAGGLWRGGDGCLHVIH